MAYKFRISHLASRRVDNILTGITIGVTCENLDTGATSELTWFGSKADFPAWPPTKQQARAYIKGYLLSKPAGSDITRAADMKAKAVIISDDPDDSWNESEKGLVI